MALSVGKERIVRSRSVSLEEEIERDLGPLHKKMVQHIFDQVRETTRDMNQLFVSGLGTFGPNVFKVRRFCNCVEGFKEQHQELCEKAGKYLECTSERERSNGA